MDRRAQPERVPGGGRRPGAHADGNAAAGHRHPIACADFHTHPCPGGDADALAGPHADVHRDRRADEDGDFAADLHGRRQAALERALASGHAPARHRGDGAR
jgi:hypothetical protein